LSESTLTWSRGVDGNWKKGGNLSLIYARAGLAGWGAVRKDPFLRRAAGKITKRANLESPSTFNSEKRLEGRHASLFRGLVAGRRDTPAKK